MMAAVHELPPPTPAPTTMLPRQAVTLWTLEGLALAIPLVAGSLLARGLLDGIDGFPGWLATLIALAGVAAALVTAFVTPSLRWRRWRYAVRDEELDLLRGVLTEVRTIVPIVRIQHVELRRTALTRAFGLAAVRVHTAAGALEIPVLSEGDAARIRDRIAGLARVPDEL
jgi:membrane protein YdbS with pleckstrin-like domain